MADPKKKPEEVLITFDDFCQRRNLSEIRKNYFQEKLRQNNVSLSEKTLEEWESYFIKY